MNTTAVDSYDVRIEAIERVHNVLRSLDKAIGRTSNPEVYNAFRCPLSAAEERDYIQVSRRLVHAVSYGLVGVKENLARLLPLLVRFDLFNAINDSEIVIESYVPWAAQPSLTVGALSIHE